jgi:acyl carrier protein
MAAGNPALVEETLKKITGRVLRREDIVLNRETTFKQLGADSLDVVQIMVALEEALDIELVDEELKAIANMGGFIDYIQNKVNSKVNIKKEPKSKYKSN